MMRRGMPFCSPAAHHTQSLVFEDLGQVGVGSTQADLRADLAGRAC